MLMKILFLFFFAAGLLFCESNFSVITIQQNNIVVVAKNMITDSGSTDKTLNKIVKDSYSGILMLIGECNREAFKDTSFNWWWMSEYNFYDVDSASLKEVKNDLKNINIKIVMGTWCSDSREQVPHFFKVMDEAGYPEDSITMVCVGRGISDSTGVSDSLKIKLVPTFIFYRDRKELGRIIETPKKTMEEDIYEILAGSTE